MWIYNNEVFKEELIDKHIGFVYIITNNINGKRYIGKKLFYFSKTKITKGKKKRIKAESDWKDYWSSSDNLKADVEKYGKENFTREILYLCKTKGVLSYREAQLQFKYEVLENQDKWYNGQIQCRVHHSHITNKL